MATASAVLSHTKIGLVTILILSFTMIHTPTPEAAQENPGAGLSQGPTMRFDYLVRADFFAGLAGDRARFERAMKLCEETLAQNPRHAEALVWHGAGLVFLAGQAFRRSDNESGRALWERGLKEMDEAVALARGHVGVLIPRGATLSRLAGALPFRDQARALLQKAVGDYEKVLAIQTPYWERLSVHARGELLSGLAEGWHRLGEREKARGYLRRIMTELPGSPYEAKARKWFDADSSSTRVPALSCTGCHAR